MTRVQSWTNMYRNPYLFQRPYQNFKNFSCYRYTCTFFNTLHFVRCVRLGYVWLQDVLMCPVTLILICTKKTAYARKGLIYKEDIFFSQQYLILLTWARWGLPSCKSSQSRPGVATTISGPRLSKRSCFCGAIPPTTTAICKINTQIYRNVHQCLCLMFSSTQTT